MKKLTLLSGIFLALMSSCKNTSTEPAPSNVKYYAYVDLKTDLTQFSEQEQLMLSYLFDAAELMNDVFWKQAYPGSRSEFLSKFANDAEMTAFAEINYGPWERLNGNLPFVDGEGDKPKGAGFYPTDMTVEEFEKFSDSNKTNQYTVIRRNTDGTLKTVWYHEEYANEFNQAAELLEKAAALAEDEGFKKYLNLRANALRTSDYFESDMAWMDMKTSKFDFVIGPIENYEDALFGYKTACESFLLIKDQEWSKKLEKFGAFLPKLQETLPVDAAYKSEKPGMDSDMNVYEVILYRGDCNAGSKTIAINLPNDERIHVQKGTRKLQLKNAMQAKFDRILAPISDLVMNANQKKDIKFDAFFENVTFHEVAHGMGIKTTITKKQSLRDALKEAYAPIEEAKADIMGLYLVDQLHQMGELGDGDLNDNYLTFFAGIFRSVRFGAASAHGKANMLCFNYFSENGVFQRDAQGIYTVDVEKMKESVKTLLAKILVLQGNGDYTGAKAWIAEKSVITPELQSDLDRVASANIPRDITFRQGKDIMGLK